MQQAGEQVEDGNVQSDGGHDVVGFTAADDARFVVSVGEESRAWMSICILTSAAMWFLLHEHAC